MARSTTRTVAFRPTKLSLRGTKQVNATHVEINQCSGKEPLRWACAGSVGGLQVPPTSDILLAVYAYVNL